MLKDADLDSLEVEKFKGGDLEPKYQSLQLPAWEGEVEDGFKIYQGSCHCGAVTYAVKTKLLSETKVFLRVFIRWTQSSMPTGHVWELRIGQLQISAVAVLLSP